MAEGTEFNHIRWSRRPGTTDLGGRIFQNASTTECRFLWYDFEFGGGAQTIEATDSVVLDTVRSIESLTTDMSVKIWQKISLLPR